MSIKKSILLRVRIAFLLVVLFAFAIVFKAAHIQLVEGSKWEQMAREISLQFRTVKATRGNIFSDNGSLMATSLPFYRVAFDPTVASDELFNAKVDSLSKLLAAHFKDRSARDYERKLRNARKQRRQYVILNHRQINHQEKKRMQNDWPIFRDGRMKGGVIFEKVEERYHPFGHLAERTIGYLNEEHKGAGLEYSFNNYLEGKDGEALFQKIAGNVWRPLSNSSDVRAEDGYDITTTLDINLQDVAESALLRALMKHEADFGCVVVMEVATGEIKAISNLSQLNDNRYAEIYNYAVGELGLTEPGSTMKLASMIALLEENNIDLNDSIETGNGSYEFFDRVMTDAKPGGHGRLTVKEAFAKSSNIAISKLVQEEFGENPQRFIDYLRKMGIAESLNFQLVGSGEPYVKNTDDPTWSGVSLPWMSIGYELKLTPLHTLAFYNAVANGGKMVQPIIVRKVHKGAEVDAEFSAKILNDKICSDRTLKNVGELLQEVVEDGTASNIRDAHYKIAGKTGTSKKLVDGKYINRYYTSFAGYFPADKPKYSCIVVIDNPKGYNQYGSDVAAPVFKEIADKIYARDIALHDPLRKVKQERGVFPVIKAGNKHDLMLVSEELHLPHIDETAEEWVTTALRNDSVRWVGNKVVSGRVPNVVGMTLKDALFVLENKGLKVYYKGNGRVSTQSLYPGMRIPEDKSIHITLD